MAKLKLTEEQKEALLTILKQRFEKNMHRHKELDWSKIQAKLEEHQEKLWSLDQMEETEGEPDVIGYDTATNEYLFYDCSKESPSARRSVCYDHEALEARKKFKPENSAMGMANEMGIELLTEEDYQVLQKLETVDTKTSSWLATPKDVRSLGGAIFGDWRFGRVFVYHNGAESYYGARGFRGKLRL